jgi:hypothetical protein
MAKVNITHKNGWMGHIPGTICQVTDAKAYDLVSRNVAEIIIDEKKVLSELEKLESELNKREVALIKREADVKKRENDLKKVKEVKEPAKDKMMKGKKTK